MIWHFVEHVRQHQHLRYLIAVTVILTSLIGFVALIASQWTVSAKSDDFSFFINLLPQLNHKEILPDMQLSFNPNEVAGALAYCCPFLLGTALMRFCDVEQPSIRFEGLYGGLKHGGH